jgi:hypothetical protein
MTNRTKHQTIRHWPYPPPGPIGLQNLSEHNQRSDSVLRTVKRPMRLSQLFGSTLRQAPAEAETVGHQLLLRAALVQQLSAGVYSALPLGWRALRKVEQIIREEMDAAGGQELMMPAILPLELWQASGRDRSMADVLFHVIDKRDRRFVLGPTHEEAVVELFKRQVRSYRDLPATVYQIQNKFRDEPRPRGGLVRLREFIMKDAYSFDTTSTGSTSLTGRCSTPTPACSSAAACRRCPPWPTPAPWAAATPTSSCS